MTEMKTSKGTVEVFQQDNRYLIIRYFDNKVMSARSWKIFDELDETERMLVSYALQDAEGEIVEDFLTSL